MSENADPDFRQDDAFVRACPEFNSGMTATISVILNLIQNLKRGGIEFSMTNNVSPPDSHQIGQRGENLAANFLQEKGYQILERNFRVKGGEIDIIAQEKNTLVFVEVKARQDDSFGLPEEAINPQKIATIMRVGEYYAACHPELPQELRLDVLAIDEENGQISFRLYRDIHKDL